MKKPLLGLIRLSRGSNVDRQPDKNENEIKKKQKVLRASYTLIS
jgi:hypothetical protein